MRIETVCGPGERRGREVFGVCEEMVKRLASDVIDLAGSSTPLFCGEVATNGAFQHLGRTAQFRSGTGFHRQAALPVSSRQRITHGQPRRALKHGALVQVDPGDLVQEAPVRLKVFGDVEAAIARFVDDVLQAGLV